MGNIHDVKGRKTWKKKKKKLKRGQCIASAGLNCVETNNKAEEAVGRGVVLFPPKVRGGLGVWAGTNEDTIWVTQSSLGQRRGCLGRNRLVRSGNYNTVRRETWTLEREQGQGVSLDSLTSLSLNIRFLFWCPFHLSSHYDTIVQVLGSFPVDNSYVASLLSQLYTHAEF